MTIWEIIADWRLREETSIREQQFGFMPGRRTTDAIFAGDAEGTAHYRGLMAGHVDVFEGAACV